MELRKQRLWDTRFLMTVGVLLAWGLVTGILSTTIFPLDPVENLLRIVVIMGLVRLIFAHKFLLWGSVLCLIFGVGALAYGFFATPEVPGLPHQAAQFLREIAQFLSGQRAYRAGFADAIVWALCVAIGFAVVLFGRGRSHFLGLFALFAVIFGLVLTAPVFVFHPAFYLSVFCILAFLIRYLNQKTARTSAVGTSFSVYAVCFAAVCMLIASAFPMPQGTLLEAIQRPIRAISDAIDDARRPDYFALRHIGFGGGGGRLGGDVAMDESLFLFVRADRPAPFYLAGAISDTYTGYAWETRHSNPVPLDPRELEQRLRHFELITSNAVALLLEERISYFSVQADSWRFPSYTLEVNLVNSTYSVFFTGFVQEVLAPDPELRFLRDQHGQITSQTRMPREAEYIVIYTEPLFRVPFDLQTPPVPTDAPARLDGPPRMLQHSYRGIFQTTSQLLEDFRLIGHPSRPFYYGIAPEPKLWYDGEEIYFEDLLNDYLIPRAAWIHETYTTLPETLPDRVRDLAHTITVGAESNYERARMLERHLSTQYRYTLTPGAPPPGRDFVDHFLFDLLEGYCVYFATAFVVMARSIGLPARYVEGFLVTGQPDENGFFHVTNNMGHAWAEVYFEGFGWLLFEPTPPLPQQYVPTGTDDPAPTPTPAPPPPGYEDEDLDVVETLAGKDPLRPDTDTGPQITIVPMIALGAFFLLVALGTRVLWVSARRGRTGHKAHDEAVRHYFGVLLQYMKRSGLAIKETETALQFLARAGGPPEVAAIFSKARYSDHTISLEERQLVENTVAELDSKMRATVGRVRYLVYKYVLGSI